VAILRTGEIVLPTPHTILQENDRILIVGSNKARAKIAEHLAPPHFTDRGAAMRPTNSTKAILEKS
jgi:hypothetical protein